MLKAFKGYRDCKDFKVVRGYREIKDFKVIVLVCKGHKDLQVLRALTVA